MSRNLVPAHLLDDITSNNCILFVGSGVSSPDLPSGAQLAREVLAAASYAGQFMPLPEAAEYYCQRCDGGRRRRLMRLLKRRLLSSRYPTKIHQLIASIPYFKTIITTNYDLLLDRTLNIVPLIEDSDLTYWDEAERQLIKLHGCITRPETIVITKDDYAKFIAHRIQGLLCKHVQSLLATKTVLFIGYSLDDPDFRVVNEHIISGLSDLLGQSYAVQLNPSEGDMRYWEQKGISIIAASGQEFLNEIQSKLISKKLVVDPDLIPVIVAESRNIMSKYRRLPSVESPYMLVTAYQDSVLRTLSDLETAVSGGVTWRALDDWLNGALTEFEKYSDTGELADFVFAGGKVEALSWFISRCKGHIPGYLDTELGRPVARLPDLRNVIDVEQRDSDLAKRWRNAWAQWRNYPI